MGEIYSTIGFILLDYLGLRSKATPVHFMSLSKLLVISPKGIKANWRSASMGKNFILSKILFTLAFGDQYFSV